MRPKIAFYVTFTRQGHRVRIYIREEYAPNVPERATQFASDADIDVHPAVVALRAEGSPIRTEYL